ncbi:MAG: octaprenyl diphosphate synthase [Thiotrichaceae bacterium]|nr:octaprenyl diphosphate synthase [Thiotrichaceae bacterium]
MNFTSILKLVADDMDSVNTLIQQRLKSDVVLVNQLSTYIINSGGKRMRPLLALLIARACNYQGQRHIDIAAIIEFIHTATLLHDDVVDESDLRRGKDTANNVWGNQAAVLVGDFLYSRSFEMMIDVGQMRVMEILAGTTNIIAEGEVLQLLNCNDADTDEKRYMEVIYSKTAKLFEAACLIGAVLAELSEVDQQSIARYGLHLGTAFQLVDDILDYSASAKEMGKNVGDDLAEGKPTLPLIIALQRCSESEGVIIRHAIEEGSGIEQLDTILEIIESTGALEYTKTKAEEQVTLATESLSCLTDNKYKIALEELVKFTVSRTH